MSTCIPQVYLGIFHEDAGFLSPSMQKPGTRQGKKMIGTVVWHGFHTYAPKPYLRRSIITINSNAETVKS
ncbi:MAG: hypothetical protein F6K31_16200, partial [Symploca sp. SIO2G7]|nr:hypothetical protein [Symploca sp. SIO2G7]